MTDGKPFPRVAGIRSLFAVLGRECAQVLDTITAPQREHELIMREAKIRDEIPYGQRPSAEQQRELRQIQASLRNLHRNDEDRPDSSGSVS